MFAALAHTILTAILPLYGYILLGYIAGRRLNVDRASIATLLFYLILPMLIFGAVVQTPLNAGYLLLPVITFTLACALCLLTYKVASWRWKGGARNVLALSAGNGNMGFFGLPIAAVVLPPDYLGMYILAMFGVTLYENSLGYYITARGSHSRAEAVQKILRLPSLYAFVLGLLLHLFPLGWVEPLKPFFLQVRGAYCILGMLMIGLGFSTVRGLRFDGAFVAAALFSKFVVWPGAALGLIALDRMFLQFYPPEIHHILFLLSIVPMAVQAVIVSTLLKVEPEKTATAVLVSSMVALITVPVMLWAYRLWY